MPRTASFRRNVFHPCEGGPLLRAIYLVNAGLSDIDAELEESLHRSEALPSRGLAMLIWRISLRISNGTVAACPPRGFLISSANIIGSRRDAIDHGHRLNNRQRIASAKEKPIKANKNPAVDGAEGLFLRSGSPQNVYLLPQHPNFHLKAVRDRNRSATIQTMSLTISLIPQEHRPILDQLLVRLSLR